MADIKNRFIQLFLGLVWLVLIFFYLIKQKFHVKSKT